MNEIRPMMIKGSNLFDDVQRTLQYNEHYNEVEFLVL
jgi:hypothetical protein